MAAALAASILLLMCWAGLVVEGANPGAPALAAGLLIPLLMLARAAGPVRRMEIAADGNCTLRGGVLDRSVELSEFTWVRCYRAIHREAGNSGVVVVLYSSPGWRIAGKVVGEFFPTVSRRRATVIISSGWSRQRGRGRIAAPEMERILQRACRASGLVVQHHDTVLCHPLWTARRPHAAQAS